MFMPCWLADVLVLLFSIEPGERAFMIEYWQSVKRASRRLKTPHAISDPLNKKRKVFNNLSDYPAEFDVGPAVPVLKGVVSPPSGKIHAQAGCKEDSEYGPQESPKRQYMVLLLALQAVSHLS